MLWPGTDVEGAVFWYVIIMLAMVKRPQPGKAERWSCLLTLYTVVFWPSKATSPGSYIAAAPPALKYIFVITIHTTQTSQSNLKYKAQNIKQGINLQPTYTMSSVPSTSKSTDEATATNPRSYAVFTRERTRRKMLRGEEKKEQKKTKKQKKTGLPGEAADSATQKLRPPAEAASTNTIKRNRECRFRKPKEPTPPVPPVKNPRKFLFEDKITPVIPRKRDFQKIIDLTGFNGMGRASKLRRNDRYIPGLLPDRNKDHEASKAWEWWVKEEFVKLGYPREFTDGPMLALETWVPIAVVSNSKAIPKSSMAGAPTESHLVAEAWETTVIKEVPCPAGCTCWDCSSFSRTPLQLGPKSRKESQSRSNTKSPQGSNRTESPSSNESGSHDFVVPEGPRTWDRPKGTGVGLTKFQGTEAPKQQDRAKTPERYSASSSRDIHGSKSPSDSRSSRPSIDSGRRTARKALQQSQSPEIQRLRQLELVSQIRNTIQAARKVTDAMAYAKASRMAVLARAPVANQPVKGIPDPEPEGLEGHSATHWQRTREVMKERGLFPTGAPHPPAWTQYVAPENAKSTHPNDWETLNPEELALDPMYAEKIGKILEKFPEVRKWRGVLPPYPVPGKHLTLQGAQFIIPNLDGLPKEVLLDYVEFVQQGDVRLRGPSSIKVGYDSELLLLYIEVWNRRCAMRETVLWSMGIATTVGWAGGLMKIENLEDVKKLYPNLAPETVKWCALLVKGFCRMPLVVGPRPEVWKHPRYEDPKDQSAWPAGAPGAWGAFINPEHTHSASASRPADTKDSPRPTAKVGMVLRPKSFYRW